MLPPDFPMPDMAQMPEPEPVSTPVWMMVLWVVLMTISSGIIVVSGIYFIGRLLQIGLF